MDTKELRRRSRMMKKKNMMLDFFRYLKQNKRKELLRMQNEQLFRHSEGADGVPLGSYESDNRMTKTGIVRKAGTPFWMENTGQLKIKMRVKVLIHAQEIEFYNNRVDIDKPWFRYNEDIYGTSDWFGLNDDHMDIVKGWAREFAVKWTNSVLQNGVRITSI